MSMMEGSIAMSMGTHLLFCTKNLERMGDHTTNIAEAIHYSVNGEMLSKARPKADFTSMLAVAVGELGELQLQSSIEAAS